MPQIVGSFDFGEEREVVPTFDVNKKDGIDDR